jgi:hypothetical protein
MSAVKNGRTKVNMRRSKNTGIPEFKSIYEEKEYWESRDPLAEEKKGVINKPKDKEKRSSRAQARRSG